jgi:hypothetical protein
MNDLTYEQTIELEANIKLKNKADEIYEKFKRNIKLEVAKYCGEGRFIIAADSHNTTYIRLVNDEFVLECRFLHETYDVTITPPRIFTALKAKYRGVEHLEAYVRDK